MAHPDERPLYLHISALSPDEYVLYTGVLDELAGPGPDDAVWDRPVDVMEARGWIRGRYGLDAAVVDKILKYFAPAPATGMGVLSAGQFFAVMRLVLHAQAGREPIRSRVFLQTNTFAATENAPKSPIPPPPVRKNSILAGKTASALISALSPGTPSHPSHPQQVAKRSRGPSDPPTPSPIPIRAGAMGSNPFRRSMSTSTSPSPEVGVDNDQNSSPPPPPPPVHPLSRAALAAASSTSEPPLSTAAFEDSSSSSGSVGKKNIVTRGTKPGTAMINTNPFGASVNKKAGNGQHGHGRQLSVTSSPASLGGIIAGKAQPPPPPLPPPRISSKQPPALPPRSANAEQPLVFLSTGETPQLIPSLPPRPPRRESMQPGGGVSLSLNQPSMSGGSANAGVGVVGASMLAAPSLLMQESLRAAKGAQAQKASEASRDKTWEVIKRSGNGNGASNLSSPAPRRAVPSPPSSLVGVQSRLPPFSRAYPTPVAGTSRGAGLGDSSSSSSAGIGSVPMSGLSSSASVGPSYPFSDSAASANNTLAEGYFGTHGDINGASSNGPGRLGRSKSMHHSSQLSGPLSSPSFDVNSQHNNLSSSILPPPPPRRRPESFQSPRRSTTPGSTTSVNMTTTTNNTGAGNPATPDAFAHLLFESVKKKAADGVGATRRAAERAEASVGPGIHTHAHGGVGYRLARASSMKSREGEGRGLVRGSTEADYDDDDEGGYDEVGVDDGERDNRSTRGSDWSEWDRTGTVERRYDRPETNGEWRRL